MALALALLLLLLLLLVVQCFREGRVDGYLYEGGRALVRSGRTGGHGVHVARQGRDALVSSAGCPMALLLLVLLPRCARLLLRQLLEVLGLEREQEASKQGGWGGFVCAF